VAAPQRKVRCTEVGRGVKGSIYVCETPAGRIQLRAIRVAPYKYDVYSEIPAGAYKTTMYARNRSVLRRQIEEWLSFKLG